LFANNWIFAEQLAVLVTKVAFSFVQMLKLFLAKKWRLLGMPFPKSAFQAKPAKI